MDIEVTAFRKYTKNTLLGFVSIRIIDLDLQIYDLTLHEKEGKRWVSLPAKPQLDADHKAIIDTVTGKPKYATVLKFASRLAQDQFQSAVLEALARDRRAA